MPSNLDWMAGGSKPQRSEVGYDVMQVCLNGHHITDVCRMLPHQMKAFCPDCGEQTITACPQCNTEIQGHLNGVLSMRHTPVPNNCHACGTAYPWRQHALAAAVEAAQLELDEKDAVEAAALVAIISTDNPRTEISALKLRKLLLAKIPRPTYDVIVKVIGDVAAATAKSHLGL